MELIIEVGIFETLTGFLFFPSGDLMEGELYSALKEEEASESVSSTNFSGEMHFYELVEDTKDGIWLVQVERMTILNEPYLYQNSIYH